MQKNSGIFKPVFLRRDIPEGKTLGQAPSTGGDQ